jgi:hypothetical protein
LFLATLLAVTIHLRPTSLAATGHCNFVDLSVRPLAFPRSWDKFSTSPQSDRFLLQCDQRRHGPRDEQEDLKLQSSAAAPL